MAGTGFPRVVVVSRPTEYAALLVRHGTREQARFFLESRGRSIDEAAARHEAQHAALATIAAGIPASWRRAKVDRADLDRFLFEPADIVVTVGSSGLVANVAKYLDGQPVVGVNPDPSVHAGIVASHAPHSAMTLVQAAADDAVVIDERAMVEADLDDGQRLLALNEVFIGHLSHQTARYTLACSGGEERQASSGIIVATGTGATGWARSIARERGSTLELPAPGDPWLVFFVREAWPSSTYAATLTEGLLGAGEELRVTSALDEGGVVFGDGIEADRLEFRWGVTARLRVARERLRLVSAVQ
jgi:NAD kinase